MFAWSNKLDGVRWMQISSFCCFFVVFFFLLLARGKIGGGRKRRKLSGLGTIIIYYVAGPIPNRAVEKQSERVFIASLDKCFLNLE